MADPKSEDQLHVEYLASLARSADSIVREEVEKSKIAYDFLEVRIIDVLRVGVMGDERSYEYPAMVDLHKDGRPVIDYELMGPIGTRIPNEVKGVNSVVWTTAKRKDE
ncbi:MAG: hypothetical protein HY514_01510 [Candidatus Aenigmarchaeota archaeon]|nr:hypothetical protein [Candidatus Aenigmarchaeota archaeon]